METQLINVVLDGSRIYLQTTREFSITHVHVLHHQTYINEEGKGGWQVTDSM